MELIAAVDRCWAIGRGERLLFSIPEDLHRFRALTEGNAIVYGRRTLSTFPNGRPLPRRRNYVLTRTPETLPSDAVGVRSVDALLSASAGEDRLFVVGGEMIYRQLLPFCRAAWITQVDTDGAGDKFCPDLDADPAWTLADCGAWQEQGALRSRFCCYTRQEL